MSFNLHDYHKPIRIVLFIVSAIPALCLAQMYITENLGINPFATLIKVSGHVAVIFVLITLAITPVRRWLVWIFSFFPELHWGKRLADWNVLIKLRRMMGIYGFFYASIHLWVYCYLEMDFYWGDIYQEIFERRFMLWGLLAWICLLLLTITSPKFVVKIMRIWWRRLHRLMYPLAIFVVLHYYFAVKVTEQYQAVVYSLVVIVLLLHRLVVHHKRHRRLNDTGMEAKR